MPVTININNISLCHKGSNGISTATIPDVCKTPAPPAPPVPIPYPNIAMSMDLMKGTKTVKADGGMMCAIDGSEFMKSTGDEPGVAGGVASSTFIKEATWITFSMDVKFEGKGACRLTDKMFHNHQNTVNMAGVIQKPVTVGEVNAATKACKDAANGRKSKSTKQSNQNCGVESSRQIINSSKGKNISEDKLLDQAMKSGDAEKLAKRIDSGGTSPEARKRILKDHGVSSTLQPQTLRGMEKAVSEGKGVIASVDVAKLWGPPNTGGHAVVVTGVVKDSKGNITEVIINDTGTGECGKHYPAGKFKKALRPGRDMNVTKKPAWK
ncbi:MAG: PAAR-like domain-containing protein [Planctomycetota bacterium]